MKKIIKRLLPWVIVLALLAALVIFVGIPLYSKDETPHMYIPTVYNYEALISSLLCFFLIPIGILECIFANVESTVEAYRE